MKHAPEPKTRFEKLCEGSLTSRLRLCVTRIRLENRKNGMTSTHKGRNKTTRTIFVDERVQGSDECMLSCDQHGRDGLCHVLDTRRDLTSERLLALKNQTNKQTTAENINTQATASAYMHTNTQIHPATQESQRTTSTYLTRHANQPCAQTSLSVPHLARHPVAVCAVSPRVRTPHPSRP
jgi:hypothetical protein